MPRSDALTTVQLAAMTNAWISGHMSSPSYIAFTNDFQPDATTVRSDLTEPTGTAWYGAKATSYGQVYEVGDGDISVRLESDQWDYTSGTACTVYGYGVITSDGTLLHAAAFETPQTMADTLDSVYISDAGIVVQKIPQSE